MTSIGGPRQSLIEVWVKGYAKQSRIPRRRKSHVCLRLPGASVLARRTVAPVRVDQLSSPASSPPTALQFTKAADASDGP